MKLGTRKDHKSFCLTEGWDEARNARGTRGSHHIVYTLTLPDGDILRTRISHPPNRDTYGASLWAHILRDQLGVSNDEFWACVDDRRLPDRGVPAVPLASLPAQLAYQLIHTVGLPEAVVQGLSRDEAVARLSAFWSPQSGTDNES